MTKHNGSIVDLNHYRFLRQTPYHQRNVPFELESRNRVKFEHKMLLAGVFFFTFWAFLAAQILFLE